MSGIASVVSSPQYTPPLQDQRLPALRWFSTRIAEVRDELGFLDVRRSPRLLRLEDLLKHPATVVFGPPWLGKSLTSRTLRDWLVAHPEWGGFEGRVARTDLGQARVATLLPEWWGQWSSAVQPSPACWIVDGLDEGEELSPNVGLWIADQLALLPESVRVYLRLLIFSRPSESLQPFMERMRNLYPQFSSSSLLVTHLARLDRAGAEELVGPRDFPRVERLIRDNRLEAIAGYPAALRFLVQSAAGTSLKPGDVWRGMLAVLLDELNPGRRTRVTRTAPNERFDAAARIAAVLTLTGSEELSLNADPSGRPQLADVFGTGRSSECLRSAAIEACGSAAFFRTAEEGVVRFAHRNVREWFAAFEISRLSSASLRSALSDGTGRAFPRYRDLLALVR